MLPFQAASLPALASFRLRPRSRNVKKSSGPTLEDWVLVGLKLRHRLPVIGNIDLNKEPVREQVDTL